MEFEQQKEICGMKRIEFCFALMFRDALAVTVMLRCFLLRKGV